MLGIPKIKMHTQIDVKKKPTTNRQVAKKKNSNILYRISFLSTTNSQFNISIKVSNNEYILLE